MESLHVIWDLFIRFLGTPVGTMASVLGAYLLLQLVILPKLGVST